MRKCLRCDAEMREGLALYGSQSGWRTDLCEMKAFFPVKWGRCLRPYAPSAAIRSCIQKTWTRKRSERT